jgi:PTH1 family peptidyl-tRNA hydrolase
VKLIVGLGNPGIQYVFTPHNLGFLAMDRIAQRNGTQLSNRHCRAMTGHFLSNSEKVVLAKPETFMNLSGASVRELVDEYEVDIAKDLVVVYDELDLPFGTLRIRERGGPAGHNGMRSIIGALNTQEFPRIRLGVLPDTGKPKDGAHYVLAQFKKGQLEAVDETLDRAAEAVEMILREGLAAAMNRFNRKVQSDDEEDE